MTLIAVKDLFSTTRYLTPKTGKAIDERKTLLHDLELETGLPLWRILKATTGMQTVKDLRFVLSSMKTVRGAKDGRHAFNIVMKGNKVV